MESGQYSADFLMVSPANGINLEVFYSTGNPMIPVKFLTGTRAQTSGTMGFTISGSFNPGYYIFSIDVLNNAIENPSFSFRYIESDKIINQLTIQNQNLSNLLDTNINPIDGDLLQFSSSQNKWINVNVPTVETLDYYSLSSTTGIS